MKLSDVAVLSQALEQTKARFVVVDPIQSYLGAEVDAHRSNETRPVLDGLARLAQENKCGVLLVRHLSKAPTGRAIHRGLGSIDLTGAVRAELFAGSSPDDPTERAMVQVKSNLGQFGPALGYTIDGDGKFRWTGISELTAEEILAPAAIGEESSVLEEAVDFLKRVLGDGARPAASVQSEARQAGITSRTLKPSEDHQVPSSANRRVQEVAFPQGLPTRHDSAEHAIEPATLHENPPSTAGLSARPLKHATPHVARHA